MLPTASALVRGIRGRKLRRICDSYDLASKFPEVSDDWERKPGLSDRRRLFAFLTVGTSAIVNTNVACGTWSNESLDRNLPSLSVIEERDVSPITLSIPLEPASGGTFCVRCTVFASNDVPNAKTPLAELFGSLDQRTKHSFRVYRAIVDTGSPYLVFPSSGLEHERKNGLSRWLDFVSHDFPIVEDDSLLFSSSGYAPTQEIYGAVKGRISWMSARFMFRDPRLHVSRKYAQQSSALKNLNIPFSAGVIGVLDDALTSEATGGGLIEPYALLGLIRSSNANADKMRFPDPRPTFFEQECMTIDFDGAKEEFPLRSFSVNGPTCQLTLSTGSLIPSPAPVMPLVDLRPLGDFVDHYAVMVDSVAFDGFVVSSAVLKDFSGEPTERPIVAVFDTGLTGCLLALPFWDMMGKFMRRKNLDKALNAVEQGQGFQSVVVSVKESPQQQSRSKFGLEVNSGSTMCKIGSGVDKDRKLFYVNPINLDWFDDDRISPYVIVLGQTFLSHGTLTIDMDERIATFTLGS